VVAVRVVDGSITHDHESITLVMRSDIATSIHVQPLTDNHNRPSHLSYPPSAPSSPDQPPHRAQAPPPSPLHPLHPRRRHGRHLHHQATQQHPTSACYTATTNSSSRSQSSGYCRRWSWYYYCCSHCVIPTISRRTKNLSMQLGLHNNEFSFTEFPEYSCLKL